MKWLKAGNTAVVTGGAGGIGLESARRFAAAGMNVVLVDRKTDALKSAEAELSSLAGKIVSVECDVSDMAAMAALRDRVDQEFGAVHCLMNNAGIGRMGTKPCPRQGSRM